MRIARLPRQDRDLPSPCGGVPVLDLALCLILSATVVSLLLSALHLPLFR